MHLCEMADREAETLMYKDKQGGKKSPDYMCTLISMCACVSVCVSREPGSLEVPFRMTITDIHISAGPESNTILAVAHAQHKTPKHTMEIHMTDCVEQMGICYHIIYLKQK